jgi:hypothetical protein
MQSITIFITKIKEKKYIQVIQTNNKISIHLKIYYVPDTILMFTCITKFNLPKNPA